MTETNGKRKKSSIKFKITLNEEQKKAKAEILNNTITVLGGSAGAGKTLLACQVALDGLLSKKYDKIVITRPTVSEENIGHLPGDVHEKMEMWLQPIFQNMFQLYDKVKIKKFIEDGKIEILPVSFMRGLTFLNACVIVDEAQNITHTQLEMITTRIGRNSKMIICGDDAQIDLRNKKDSGYKFLYTISKKVKNMVAISLKTNHRDPIVDDLLFLYNEFYEKTNNIKR